MLEFETSLDDQTFNVIVNGCTVKNRSVIEAQIRSICELIKEQKFETEYLPGLASVLSDKQTNDTQTSLDKIQSRNHNFYLKIMAEV